MQNLLKNKWVQSLFLSFLVCGIAGCSSEAKRARHMKRAEAYFQKGEYIKAEIEYRNVGRFSKTVDPLLVSRLASLYYAQGRIVESFSLFTNAVALNPEDVDLRYKLGTIWVTFRNYSNALESALFVLKANPAHHEGKLLLADAARKPEEIAVARQRINEILKTSGESWSAHVALAQLALRETNLALAEKEIEAAARLDAKASQVTMTRAQIASLRKQPQEAERLLPLVSENAPARSPQRLLLAQSKMQGTNLAEAKTLVDQILKEAPDYVPAWALLGKIAMAEKDYAECNRIASKVMAWAPTSYDILLLNARALLLQGNTTNAIQRFDQLLTIYDYPEAKYEAAVAYVRSGNAPEAIKRLDDLTRLYPDYSEAVVLRAELKLRTGEPQQAVDSLLSFSKRHPDFARDDLTLASAYRVQGKYDEALAIYRGLIRKYPSVPEFWFLDGAVLLQQKKPDQARGSFEQALILAPAYLLAAEQIVDIDLARKNFDAAQLRVDEQLKLTTNSPGAIMLEAKVCFAKRDWAGAESALTRVIKAQPDAMVPYSLLAQVYLSTGEPKRALAQLQSALDRNPKDTMTLMLMATIHSSLKNYDKAKILYEDVLKLNPSMPAALNDLAYLLSEKLNQVEQALPYATKARGLAPNDPGVEDTLGWIFYRRGEYARALPLLSESAEKMPKQAEVQYHLAMLHYTTGDEAAARTGFDRVTELDKALADAQGVPRRLAVLGLDASAPQAAELLESAVKEDGKDFIAALKLGQVYERTGANEKARAALERAARLNPSSARPLVLLASLNADKLKDLPKALEAGRAARKVAPNDPMLAGLLGRLSYRANDYAAALALLQEYARSAAADAEALFDLGLAYYSVGQLEEARVNLRRYIAASRSARVEEGQNLLVLAEFHMARTNPTQSEAIAAARMQRNPHDLPGLMTLGLVAQQNGKYSDAANRFEQIIALNKAFAPAQRQLAILYAEHLVNDQKAYDFGSKARQAFPNDPELAIALGKASYRRNDFRNATLLLEDAIRGRQSDAEAFFYMGMAHHKLQKKPEAKLALNRALALNLSSKLKGEALKALQEIQ